MARRFGGNRFKPRFREPLHRTNERIRVPSVRVVTEDGETLGVMDTRDAIQEARNRGIDLVEIAPNGKPPVCKLIDYGKFLYEQKKRAHEAKKKQVTVQVKEIKFRPGTDDHDYNYRMEHAKQWLGEGDKVRAAIAFRGREMTHRELGAKILKKLTLDLAELADVEVFPKMEGYQMFTIFNPKKAKVADAKKVSTTDSIEADDVAPKIKKAPKEQKVKAPKPEPKDDDEIF
ncbi:MAG TPA: translation initiation factor IF-3 [Pyrinomonadaceae bacterium]|nr:translation initiation factor IF-3 [Acidobacteriota bacterium]HQZ95972.1 translation initiation factor IF-3 [Pyrinomonadaceae bacterium]